MKKATRSKLSLALMPALSLCLLLAACGGAQEPVAAPVEEQPLVSVGEVSGGVIEVTEADGAYSVKLTPGFGYTWNENAALYLGETALSDIAWTLEDSLNGYTTVGFDAPDSPLVVSADFAQTDCSAAAGTDVDYGFISSSGSGTPDDPYVFPVKYDELGNKFTWKTLQSMVSGTNEQNMDKYAGKCVSLYATADNKGASSIIWRIDVTEYFADDLVTKRPYFLGHQLTAAEGGELRLDMYLRSAIAYRYNYTFNVSDYFADGEQLKIAYVDGSCNDPASDHSNGAGDVQSSLEAMAAAAPCGQNVPSDLAGNGGSGSKTAGNISQIEAATYEVSNGLITINGLNFGGSFIISSAS